jgi:S1 RNA binding domain protein
MSDDPSISREEPEFGQTYSGKVVELKSSFAVIALPSGQRGLLHISEIAPQMGALIGELMHVGDTVNVRVTSINDGRIKLALASAYTIRETPDGVRVDRKIPTRQRDPESCGAEHRRPFSR